MTELSFNIYELIQTNTEPSDIDDDNIEKCKRMYRNVAR